MIETDRRTVDARSPSLGGRRVAPVLRGIGRPGRTRRIVAGVALVSIIATGSIGAYRYARSYYMYRGYAPPVEPHFVETVARKGHVAHRVVVVKGTILKTNVWSTILGGRWISTYVFLPPGYFDHPENRYPVLYFLHGLHSAGFTYLTVLGGAVDEDVLVAEQRMKPMIVVIPSGSYHQDTEWADTAIGKWDTFVATDLVNEIDARYRTIRASEARVLAGLSEGGYGALNIGLHHPRIFGTIESWSGYSIADVTSHVFGDSQATLAENSPLYTLPAVAATLLKHHVYVYFYVGREDPFFGQNLAFANELTEYGIAHRFFWEAGGHGWRLWRRQMVPALIAASDHVNDASA